MSPGAIAARIAADLRRELPPERVLILAGACALALDRDHALNLAGAIEAEHCPTFGAMIEARRLAYLRASGAARGAA